jgi:Uri superfamily endonuclease
MVAWSDSRVVVLGDAGPAGAYVLRMEVSTALRVRFGRFQGGRLLDLPAGEYVYVGSALGARGSATPARRLLRHATRCAGPPQPLRDELLRLFAGTPPPRGKTLHWHVDYLLEETAVTLAQIFLLHSPRRLETAVARWLMAQPETAVIVPGLGARDAPGDTHLLRVTAPAGWWTALPARLARFLDAA